MEEPINGDTQEKHFESNQEIQIEDCSQNTPITFEEVKDDDNSSDSSRSKSNCSQQQNKQDLPEQGTNNARLVLEFKVNELQKICSSLAASNEKLLIKIDEMEEEIEEKNHRIKILQETQQEEEFNEGYSQIHTEISTVEEMIADYKQQLSSYEAQIKDQLENFNQSMEEIESQLSSTTEQLKQTQEANLEAQSQISELLNQNQSLMTEIEELQARNESLEAKHERSSQYQYQHRYQTPSNRGRYFEETESQFSSFDSTVQRELENLIQKLVKELESQRKLKNKMTQQIKRLQKQLLDSEREIMSRNNKIHHLEMQILRGNKGGQIIQEPERSATSRQRPNQSRVGPKKLEEQAITDRGKRLYENNFSKQTGLEKPSEKLRAETKKSKNCNLLQFFLKQYRQLINDENLSIEERLTIAAKIVEFFRKKLANADDSILMLENLQIINFNRINTNLILIRKVNSPNISDNFEQFDGQGQNSESKIVWNLGFILNQLLCDNNDADGNSIFGLNGAEENILELIGDLLENRSLSLEAFDSLRDEILCALKLRKQSEPAYS